MGSGLILLEALKVLDEGGEFRDAKRAAQDALRRCNVLFAVSTLEYLQRSGRIGRAQRLVGTALDIRPVLKIEDGEVVPHKRARGRKRQISAIVEQVKPAAEAGQPLYFGQVEAAEDLDALCRELGVERTPVAEIGGVVGTHVGPGAYGVAHL